MNIEILTEFRHEKEIYRWWKQEQTTWKGHKDLAQPCSNGERKAKARLELTLAKEVKANMEGFYKYIARRRKVRSSVGQ